MTHHHMHTKEFVVGAVVGSLLGSVAALLAAPKSGEDLREDICDAYCDFTEKTHDLAKKGKCLAKNMSGYGSDWACKARSTVDGLKKNVNRWTSNDDTEEEWGGRDLLFGVLAGGVLGAAAGLFLAPKPGEELVQDIVDRYEEVNDKAKEYSKKGKAFAKTARSKANKWIDFAKEIVEELSEDAEEKGEDLIEKTKEFIHNGRINEIIDWANLGYRVWKGVKSRR